MTAVESYAMSEQDARRITERIRATAINARESLEKLQHLLTQARDGDAWSVLGYNSWTAYLADVMGEQPLRLPRDQRQEIVGYLAGEGMSNRATAEVVGATEGTIRNDLRAIAGAQNYAPAPIVGASHMQVQRDRAAVTNVPPAPTANTTTGEVSDDYVTDQTELDSPATEQGEPEPEVERPSPTALPPVTGLDGKTYTRTEPTKPRRTPLPDSIRNAVLGAETKLTTLRDLTRDDRWSRNAEEVAPRLRNDLRRLNDLLEQVGNSLPTEEVTAHD